MNKVNSRNYSKFPVKHPKSTKKLWFIGVSLLILLLVTGLFSYRHFSKDDTRQPTTAIEPANQINYEPPTEEEQKQTEAGKDRVINEKPAPVVTDSSGKKIVTPVITSGDKNGATAYITGIFEEGGTCTATYTRGADVITTKSTGFQNSNYTSCAPLVLDSPLNIAGDWKLIVSYSSDKSAGSSEALTIKVN